MNNIATIITLLVGMAGLLGFAGAVVNGKRKDGYNVILKDSNTELRSAVDDRDKQIDQLNSKIEIAQAAADAADKVRQAAVDMAQSRPQFETLGMQMVKQHKELLSAIGKQQTSSSRDLLKLTAEISNLAKTIAKKENQE